MDGDMDIAIDAAEDDDEDLGSATPACGVAGAAAAAGGGCITDVDRHHWPRAQRIRSASGSQLARGARVRLQGGGHPRCEEPEW